MANERKPLTTDQARAMLAVALEEARLGLAEGASPSGLPSSLETAWCSVVGTTDGCKMTMPRSTPRPMPSERPEDVATTPTA